MSWSITIIGKPDKIKEELNSYADTLTGQSKQEYEEAKPHLAGLVSLSVGDNLIKISASGHANFVDGKKTFGSIAVIIEQFWARLAI